MSLIAKQDLAIDFQRTGENRDPTFGRHTQNLVYTRTWGEMPLIY